MQRLRVGKSPGKFLVLWGVVAVVGWYGRLPQLAPVEASTMAARFQFERLPLPRLRDSNRTHRVVNPKLQGIVSWISSVGAGIALGDLDGDGLSNDACLVDPRTDDVIVTPLPGTDTRFQPFTLVATPLRYDPSTMAPMGCLMVDLNEDGLRDLVVYYWGRPPVAFLRRTSDAKSPLSRDSFVAQELVPATETWYTNAALAADLDGDGHADLWFGNYFPDGSVVLGKEGPVEMQASMSHANNGGSKPILRWVSATAGDKPSVHFERLDVSEFGQGWTLALAACDLDGDLFPDVYIANDFGPDRLLHNESVPGQLHFRLLRGRRGLTTPKSKTMGQDSFKGMGVDCADLNGDGLPDLMVSNITDSYALEESNLVYISTGETALMRSGVAPYREVSEEWGLARSGWSWDVRFGDFDNDGAAEIVQATGFVKGSTRRWPELQELAMGNDLMVHDPSHWPRFVPGDDLSGGNHDRFYVRSSSGRYFDLAPLTGLGDAQVTRGVAVADADGDGRLDFALANQWGDSFYFHNVSPSTGAFLGLHILLPVYPAGLTIRDGHPDATTPAYPALGALVSVFTLGGRKLVQQVDGGNGHSGKSSPDLHFGLGNERGRVRVAFDWRDREGVVRHYETSLMPGWHTALLGNSQNEHD